MQRHHCTGATLYIPGRCANTCRIARLKSRTITGFRRKPAIPRALALSAVMVSLKPVQRMMGMSGRMRRNYIRVMLEDRVVVELSTYDLTRGRLVYRHK